MLSLTLSKVHDIFLSSPKVPLLTTLSNLDSIILVFALSTTLSKVCSGVFQYNDVDAIDILFQYIDRASSIRRIYFIILYK